MYLANSRIYQCNDRATLFIAVAYSAIKMMQKVAAVGYSPVVKPAIALFSSKVSVVKDGGLIVIVVHIPIARDAGFDLFRHIPFPFAITNTSIAVVDVAAVYIAVDCKHRWHVTLSTSEYSSHTPYGRSFNFVGRTKLISFYRIHFTTTFFAVSTLEKHKHNLRKYSLCAVIGYLMSVHCSTIGWEGKIPTPLIVNRPY